MDRGGEEFQPWGRERSRRSLPVYHLRLLGAGMAGWQVLSLAGLWGEGLESIGLVAALGVSTNIVALAVAIWLVVRAELKEPLSRKDLWLLVVQAVSPLCPSVLMFLAGMVLVRDDVIDSALMTGLAGLILFTLPATVLAARVRLRLGDRDVDWNPQAADKPARFVTVLALCLLFGGWAGGLAGLAFGLRMAMGGEAMLEWDGEASGVATVVQGLQFGLVAQGVGLFLGGLSSVVIAPALSVTRLDKALGPTFLPPVVVAVLASIFNPFLGILLTGLTLFIAALISRRLFRWYPPGQCVGCGYSMSGLTTKVCPECGHEHASAGDSM